MDTLAEKANEKILEWAKGKPKLVVALDGYTGARKTTLVATLKNYRKKYQPEKLADLVLCN